VDVWGLPAWINHPGPVAGMAFFPGQGYVRRSPQGGKIMMRAHIRYQVKEDQIDANKEAVSDFIEKVKASGDSTYRYECFQSKKEPSHFVHVAFFDDEAAKDRFFAPDYFKEFSEGLKSRCAEGPNATFYELVATSAES
jgi:quinol monooxygenase YgiN